MCIWSNIFNPFSRGITSIKQTRDPKGHISCTWVHCATFLKDWPGRPFLCAHRHEKHKLGRGCWDLASCQVSLNSVLRFQRRSRKCLSQSEARAAILFFWSAQKTQTWYRTLRSCFLSSFVEFWSAVSEKKSKMWKVNDDRQTTCDYNSVLEPSAQVH